MLKLLFCTFVFVYSVKATCTHQGHEHETDDHFPDNDGCNHCFCMENGAVSCTMVHCVGCNYGGVAYTSGDSFQAFDNCNTCKCTAGKVGCTHKICPTRGCLVGDNTYDIDETFKDDCNSCTCEEGGIVACTLMACPMTVDARGPKTCSYEGKIYDKGFQFPSKDGCNQCICSNDGSAACTYSLCTGNGSSGSSGGLLPAWLVVATCVVVLVGYLRF